MKLHSFLTILIFPLTILADVSISEIQFTLDAGDGTYPSPLVGQSVTTGGIVSATDFSNGRYFISSSEGGAWNGIYVYDDSHSPTIGDSLHFQAEVYEYHGFTELKSLSDFSTVSSGNLLPSAIQISTSDVAGEEAYESVLVEVNNLAVTSGFDSYGEWRVSDGSGECIVSNGVFNLADLDVSLIAAYPFSTVRGVVAYSWDEFRLHPRSIADIQAMPGAYIISTGSADAYDLSEVVIPIQLALFGSDVEVQSFDFEIMYNPAIVQYSGYSQEGTLSSEGVVSDNSSSGRVTISYSGQLSLTNIGNLLNISFVPIDAGNADLVFSSAHVNGQSLLYKTGGNIGVFISGESIGDTLTIIQRPLPNIPTIVTPGEPFEITCLAPENTTNWSAAIVYESISTVLTITQANYDAELSRWFLETITPEPDFFELYDLEVTANGLHDITKNAVHVIPERKSSYNFIHITDIHLPTNAYYFEPHSIGDSSSMLDLRAIIEDVNLIHPEFVLITGDYINEGELEDFQNRRYYTKALRMLSEFEVPVYLVSGNHDIGGWNDTPPPQGTARRDWWRFFGWSWLDSPPLSQQVYTQDYSFDYGPIHYVGLEAYDNYDGFRSDIYGGQSFTSAQLQWLEADISGANSASNVMFYHYDFSEQLNLSSLGVDMALWGHTHQISGDISVHPYNLSSGTTSHGNRTYRVLRVEDNVLRPEEVVYSDWPLAESLLLTYNSDNDGSVDTATATIRNSHGLDFEDAQVKFSMPIGDHWYSIEGGELTQVVRQNNLDVCYVNIDLPANSERTVTIIADSDLSSTISTTPKTFSLHQNFPNPFNPTTQIYFELPNASQVRLVVFDIRGEVIRNLLDDSMTGGKHVRVWDGLDNQGSPMESGIYFYTIDALNFNQTRKMTLLR